MTLRAPLLGLLGLCACDPGPTLATIDDAPPMITATVTRTVSVPALLPSDLLVRQGEWWVLDGDQGRVLRIGTDGQVAGTLGDVATWGHPLRLAEGAADGVWLTDPAGRILQIDATGAVTSQLPAPPLDAGGAAEPVALLDLGDALVVSDRSGRVSWLDPSSGEVRRSVQAGAEGEPFAILADLARLPGGDLVGVDTLSGHIEVLSETGEALLTQARYGAWVGTLQQPRAVVALDGGGIAVADAEQGAVQIFDAQGAARGVVAVDGQPLRLVHPVALERGADGALLILDAGAATVLQIALDRPSLQAALAGTPRRWLRMALSPARELPPEGGQRCLSCHSGLVHSGREVWDAKTTAHPVNIKPEMKIPDAFPLNDQGDLVCTTCHSPHEATGDTFLRASRQASELCVACHTQAAHDDALVSLGLGGGGHPTGQALATAMAARRDSSGGAAPAVVDASEGQCLGCHAMHGATGDHLTRGETDGSLCVTCHAAQNQEGHVACRSCHALVEGKGEALLRTPEGGPSVCTSCHTDVGRALGGAHRRLHDASGIGCLSCHDPHGSDADHALLRGAGQATAADPSGCLSCHGPKGNAAKVGVRPGLLGHPVDGQPHGSDTAPLTCETCHAGHDPTPSAEVSACVGCHAEQAEASHRGGHGEVTCLGCHPMHSAAPTAKSAASQNPRSAACLACHATDSARADAPKVASFTHPALVFAPDGSRWTPIGGLPLYAADGGLQPTGTNGALTCASCHLTHGPDAAQPGDHLRRPGWEPACAACHGEEALPLYRYFHQPDRWDDLKESP